MQENKLEHIRNLYKKLVSQKTPFYTTDEGVAKAKRPGYAYHCEAVVSMKEMMNTFDLYQMCNYHEVPLITEPLYMFAAKHSPLTEFFKMQ